ncbi:hypothetical protein [Streptomyces sp. NPDC088775]|uniref:hypothetical protein n=1 Tax=Streptomyces sp. NPDC088775 TaxID=3365896 RepID=UPI00383006CB
MSEPTVFAWCFSHGRLHHFVGEPWCTATWALLSGSTEEEALAAKTQRYGEATFLHQLPDEQQLALIRGSSDCTA